MSKIYIRNNNTVRLTTLPMQENVYTTLPAGVWRFIVDKSMMGTDMHFEQCKPFQLPKKLFGDVKSKAEHILKYRLNNKGNLGVLLHGISGTGKSLLAKYLSSELVANNYPVIIVDARYIKYLPNCIEQLNQPSVILLDEFEKMYENVKDQSELLTILDGVYQSDHTFILTANDTNKINDFMFNRPSRIRYSIEYDSLDYETLQEILASELQNQNKIHEVTSVLMQINELSYDNLIQFINEINSYPNKSVKDLAEIFNLEVQSDDLDENYSLTLSTADDVDLATALKDILAKYDITTKACWYKPHDLTIQNLIQLSEPNQFNYSIGTLIVNFNNHSSDLCIIVGQIKNLTFKRNITGSIEYSENMELRIKSFIDYMHLPDDIDESIYTELKALLSEPMHFTYKKLPKYNRFAF